MIDGSDTLQQGTANVSCPGPAPDPRASQPASSATQQRSYFEGYLDRRVLSQPQLLTSGADLETQGGISNVVYSNSEFSPIAVQSTSPRV